MVTYPLDFPSVGVVNSQFGLHRVNSVSVSPFTGSRQVYNHQGEWWYGEVTFRPTTRAEVAEVQAFLAKLRGQYGTFLYGDPDALALGTLGSPSSVLGTTNHIRNNVAAGATVGVLGSGGALPTNWSVDSASGLTTEVISTGTASNGLPYVRVRVSGTTTGNVYRIRFESNTQIVAAAGQTWTGSFYAALSGGTLTNVSSSACRITEHFAGGTTITNDQTTFTLSASITRATHTRTLTDASTARTNVMISLATTIGVSVDFTIDLMGIQMEQQSSARVLVQTSGSADTRPDGLTVNGASQTGNDLDVWGFPASTSNLLKIGDYIQLGSGASSTLHLVTNNVSSDIYGKANIEFEPKLRTSPADGAAVTYTSPKCVMQLVDNDAVWQSDFSSVYSVTIGFREAITA